MKNIHEGMLKLSILQKGKAFSQTNVIRKPKKKVELQLYTSFLKETSKI